jgi:mannose-6-phosphate isomerase
MSNDYYPLKLRAIAKEKIWGGKNLARFLGKSFAADALIGETWEAWEGCFIGNGAQAEKTLGDLIGLDPQGILGGNARGARFPLLFKFIDAQDDLSVQVHPDDAAAQAMENYPYGKTEAWYIVHAEPDAALIHGFKADLDAARLRKRLAENDLPDALSYVPVTRGDVIFVPAGTVHAITRGIVLAEIQENSDITYRLYDWGRRGKGRELHIEPSLRVANLHRSGEHKISRLTIRRDECDQHFLAACRYFSYELFDLRAKTRLEFGDKFNIVSLIAGAAIISYGAGLAESVGAMRGETFVLPARLGRVDIAPRETPCQMLRAYVPDLRADVIAPLARTGYRASEIARLGGFDSGSNDLTPLVS